MFPKIGFADPYTVSKVPFRYGGAAHPLPMDSLNNFINNQYYFPILKILGLTHLVTGVDQNVTLNSSFNSDTNRLKIFDLGIEWRQPYSKSFLGSYAEGVSHLTYPYEVGGDTKAPLSPTNGNYGFGTPSQTAFWFGDPVTPYTPATGENKYDSPLNVRFCEVEQHQPGFMLYAKLNNLHQTVAYFDQLPVKYKVTLNAKITATQDPDEIVAIVYVLRTDQFVDENVMFQNYKHFQEPPINYDSYQNVNSMVCTLKVKDFNQNGAYTDVQLDSYFYKTEPYNYEMYFAVYWAGSVDLSIDRVMINNQMFDDVFITQDNDILQGISEAVANEYLVYSTCPDKIEAEYIDEPPFLRALAFNHLNKLAFLHDGDGSFHYNGATGAWAGYYTDYLQEFKTIDYENESSFNPYMIYDFYPFSWPGNSNYQSSFKNENVQKNLDTLVNKPQIIVGGESGLYLEAGLLPAIYSAQMRKNDPTNSNRDNDRALFHTMQVQAEHKTNLLGELIDAPGSGKRAPTRDEIFAQGWLALNYGAKGLMFYIIPTNTWEAGTDQWNYYGLLDQQSNEYTISRDLSKISGLVQDPVQQMVPNSRYYAVQEFIDSLEKIENTLLNLSWVDGGSYHRNGESFHTFPKSFISGIITNRIPLFATPEVYNQTPDIEDSTHVEVGIFEEIESGYRKYFTVVNRRCNTGELDDRSVRIEIIRPVAGFDDFVLTDISTGETSSIHFSGNTYSFRVAMRRASGKLFKIEPLITNITQNTSLSHSLTLYSDLTVSNNATLTIAEGAILTFENHSRLLLSNGNLTVNGTAQKPVVFDFVTPYWAATTNGIVNNYGNVVLNHTKIKNAAIGYYSYSTDNDDIQNCEIFDNQWGIVMHWTHSYGTEKAKIINCNIHDNSTLDNQGRGITLSNSSPKIYATTIRKNDYGLYCTTNSNPYDTTDEINGYNMIDSNDVGIISYYSSPMLGYVEDEQGGIFYLGGGNTIKNNSIFNVEADTNSIVYVERNYWGTKDPGLFNIYSDSSSIVYTDYYLDDPPTGSFQSGLTSKATMKIDAEWMPPGQGNFTSGGQFNLLRAARKQIRLGNMTAARAILLPLINNPENMQMSCEALEIYGKTYNPEDIESYFPVLQTVGNRPDKNDLTAKALFLLSEYQIDRKETHLTNLITVYQGTDHAARASYLKIVHLIGEGNRIEEIETLKADMNSLYPLSSYTKEVNYLITSGTNMMKPSTATTTETLPFEYKIIGGYPNPFNPETTIRYSLGGECDVDVEIFDINGTRVLNGRDTGKQAGIYNYKWNASAHASGVYFVRITAKGTNGFYTFTSKLMLVK
ncbi:MAG: hypothetical protein AMXMBFR49_20570 [Chlorobiota bacterium]